jgi:hypothetical protein
MKNILLSLIILICISGLTAIQVSGNQTGIWSPDNNPYEVIGAISVPAGSNLEIQAGVLVHIMGSFQITVAGTLNAMGTVADSIRFVNMQANPTALWPGLRFENITQPSQLNYVYVEYGTYGVRCMNSLLTISHCRFNRCEKGMELYANGVANPSNVLVEQSLIENCIQNGILITQNSNAVVDHNEIRFNGTGAQFRAAIQLANQSAGGSNNPTISYNHIHHNLKQGISAWDVSSSGAINPLILNNVIEYNYTGVYLLQASGYVADNQINYNFIPGDMNSGAGVMVSGATSEPYFERNTVIGNYTGFYVTNNARPILGDLALNHVWAQGENIITDNIDANNVLHSVYCDAYPTATNVIKAENNNWGTSNIDEIAAGINDHNDNPALPTVDYAPFLSPISPTSLIGSYTYNGTADVTEVKLQLIAQASGAVINEVLLLSSPFTVQAMVTEQFYVMIVMTTAATNMLYGCAGGFINPTIFSPGDFVPVDLGTIAVTDAPAPRYEIIGAPIEESGLTLYPIMNGFALYGWQQLDWVYISGDNLIFKRNVTRSPDGELVTELPDGTIYKKFQNILPDDTWYETRIVDNAGTAQTFTVTNTPCSTFLGTVGYQLLTRKTGGGLVIDKQITSAEQNNLYRYQNGYVVAQENILHFGLENPISVYSTTLFVPEPASPNPSYLAYNPDIWNEGTSQMQVRLFWQAPAQGAHSWIHYRIYRNEQLLTEIPFTQSEFTDTSLPNPEGYLYYQVCAWDGSVESELTNVATVIIVNNDDNIQQPVTVQVYPNPTAFSAHGNLEIKLSNLQDKTAELAIYNIKGQKVHSQQLVGDSIYRWNGKDKHGNSSAAGIYFLKVQVKGESPVIRKLIIL